MQVCTECQAVEQGTIIITGTDGCEYDVCAKCESASVIETPEY